MDPIVEAGDYFSGSEDTSEEDRKVRRKTAAAATGPLPNKMSARKGGFHFGRPLKFGSAAPPDEVSPPKEVMKSDPAPLLKRPMVPKNRATPKSKRPKKQGNLVTLEATMGSFLKIVLYECFFTEGVWNAPPNKATDSPEVLAEKVEIARLMDNVATFKGALNTHVNALCRAFHGHLLQKVDGNAGDPLIIFFEQMLLHNELHVEHVRKPPVITKDRCVYDVWTGEVYNIDQMGNGDSKRRKTKKTKGVSRKLLTLVPDNEGDPFSVVCVDRGSWVLTAVHNLMHFQSYVVSIVKCRGVSKSSDTFQTLWNGLTGRHALKPVNKWAWTKSTPFVMSIMSLYKTLVVSFTILRDLEDSLSK
jgi:hypothetical protein